MTNQLKKKLIDGKAVIVVDMEHGPIDMGPAENMMRAADVAGATPIARVSHNTRHLIMRALDIGAHGLHVPDINTESDARAAVASSKYGPDGKRGMAGVRALGHGLQGALSEHAAQANAETMVIAHIEDIESIHNLDALLDVDGIDVYYLGPTDLSNSLGIPGQTNEPKVRELVDDTIARIVRAGKMAGCISVDGQTAKRYIDMGAKYIVTHALKFMTTGSLQFIEDVRS